MFDECRMNKAKALFLHRPNMLFTNGLPLGSQGIVFELYFVNRGKVLKNLFKLQTIGIKKQTLRCFI